MADKIQETVEELRETAARIEAAVTRLMESGIKYSLLVHAVHKEANRGLYGRNMVGKRAIERVLDALSDIESLLFEGEDENDD